MLIDFASTEGECTALGYSYALIKILRMEQSTPVSYASTPSIQEADMGRFQIKGESRLQSIPSQPGLRKTYLKQRNSNK